MREFFSKLNINNVLYNILLTSGIITMYISFFKMFEAYNYFTLLQATAPIILVLLILKIIKDV